MSPPTGAAGRAALVSLLEQVDGPDPMPPFALLHRAGAAPGDLELLRGPVLEAAALAEISPEAGAAGAALVLVPFRMAASRGMACHDDRAPLLVMPVHERTAMPLDVALEILPERAFTVRDGGFDISDAEYGDTVRRVVEDEIGSGAGCNFVISRSYTGHIEGYRPAHALAVFRNLLRQEQGAYWTFVIHTGERTFVGATPERHVTLSDGTATMNPISGTYRYPPTGATIPGLVGFLNDRKESDELYMVLDEELKMMAAVCDDGLRARGPLLKEMRHLAHTEYFIGGHTRRGAAELLERTMFAPTVVGSPLENAFRVIAAHERRGRGYYSGIAALVGRDRIGRETLDSAIMIRTAEIEAGGNLRLGVGATVVRHSRPAAEAAETRAKASGLLAAMGQGAAAGSGAAGTATLGAGKHPEVARALSGRNSTLNSFWLAGRGAAPEHRRPLAGRRLLVLDAEDRFTAMLGHHLRALGAHTEIRSCLDRFSPGAWDCVVAGPGPGDPLDAREPRIARLRTIVEGLLSADTPLLAVCLSHQVLSTLLGLRVVRRSTPNQGTQREIDLFGAPRRVGFYNTFSAVADADSFAVAELAGPVEACRDAASGEVHALRGPGFVSYQFHPESVLTERGPAILGATVTALLGRPTAARSANASPTGPVAEPVR